MSQTTITTTLAAAFAGMLANATDDPEVMSAAQTEASAEIPFGVMLARGTGDRDAKLPAASNAKLFGVLLHSHQYAKGTNGELGDTGVKPGAALNVLRNGYMYVTVEEAVAPGDRGFVRFGSTGSSAGTQKGAFRKSQETISAVDYCIDVSAKVEFLSTTGAGGVALVHVDMSNT